MKLAATLQKIKNFWDNPLSAPMTAPLNMIGKASYSFMAPFAEGIRDAVDTGDRSEPLIKRIFSEWMDKGVVTAMTTMFSGLIGAIGGGILAGSAVPGLIPASFAAVAGAGIGAVATPFLVVGALAFAGAALGLLAAPYGLGKGIYKAIKHVQFQKTQQNVVKAVPALQSQSDVSLRKATEIFKTLRDLPEELRTPVLKAINDEFAASARGNAGRIEKAIDVLPEDERNQLIQALRIKLAASFERAVQADAEDATQLQRRIKPLETVRFAPKPKAGAV